MKRILKIYKTTPNFGTELVQEYDLSGTKKEAWDYAKEIFWEKIVQNGSTVRVIAEDSLKKFDASIAAAEAIAAAVAADDEFDRDEFEKYLECAWLNHGIFDFEKDCCYCHSNDDFSELEAARGDRYFHLAKKGDLAASFGENDYFCKIFRVKKKQKQN